MPRRPPPPRSGGRAQFPSAKKGAATRPQATRSTPRSHPSAPSSPAKAWLLRCPAGLARLVTQELRHGGMLSRTEKPLVLRQRGHDLLFLRSLPHPPSCRGLWLVEEILACPVFGRFKISASQFDRLAEALEAGKHRKDGGQTGKEEGGKGKAGGTPRKLAISVAGSHFQRQDLLRFIGRELASRHIALSERAESFLWLYCIDEAFYFGLPQDRDDNAPHRTRRQAERRAALPAPIAAAMAFLANARPTDLILDPVCGSGTLLAEAAARAPGASLYGIDNDRAAIDTARRNLASTPSASLAIGDGTATGLEAGTFSLFLANLPFGKAYGDRDSNPALYQALLTEMHRLGTPQGWRAVLLTSDSEALASVLEDQHGLTIAARHKVSVRGEMAEMVLIRSEFAPRDGE